MYKPLTVGKKMDDLRKRFLEAMDSSRYNAKEKRRLGEAIHALDYIKEFFAGTSQLPPLEENSATMWGKTFELLKVAFGNIIAAENLLEKNDEDSGCDMEQSYHVSSKKSEEDMESEEDSDDLLLGLFLGLGM